MVAVVRVDLEVGQPVALLVMRLALVSLQPGVGAGVEGGARAQRRPVGTEVVGDVDLVALRDRLVEPSSIPHAFIRRFASAMNSTVEVVQQYLSLPPMASAAVHRAARVSRDFARPT